MIASQTHSGDGRRQPQTKRHGPTKHSNGTENSELRPRRGVQEGKEAPHQINGWMEKSYVIRSMLAERLFVRQFQQNTLLGINANFYPERGHLCGKISILCSRNFTVERLTSSEEACQRRHPRRAAPPHAGRNRVPLESLLGRHHGTQESLKRAPTPPPPHTRSSKPGEPSWGKGRLSPFLSCAACGPGGLSRLSQPAPRLGPPVGAGARPRLGHLTPAKSPDLEHASQECGRVGPSGVPSLPRASRSEPWATLPPRGGADRP